MHLLTSETKTLGAGNERFQQQIELASSRTVKEGVHTTTGTICLDYGPAGGLAGGLPTLLINAPEDPLQRQRDSLLHYHMINRGKLSGLSDMSSVSSWPGTAPYRHNMSKPNKVTTDDHLPQRVPLTLPGICDMYSIVQDKPSCSKDGGNTSREGFLGGKALHTTNTKSKPFQGVKRGAPAEEWSQQTSLGKKKAEPHPGRIETLNNPYKLQRAAMALVQEKISKRLTFPAIQSKMEEQNSDSSLTSGSDSSGQSAPLSLPPVVPKYTTTFTGLTVKVDISVKKKNKTSGSRSKVKAIMNVEDEPTSRIERYGPSTKGNGNHGNLKPVCQTQQLETHLKEAGLNLPNKGCRGMMGSISTHSVMHDCRTRSHRDIWRFLQDSVDLYKDNNRFSTLLNNSNIVIDHSNYDLFERRNQVKP